MIKKKLLTLAVIAGPGDLEEILDGAIEGVTKEYKYPIVGGEIEVVITVTSRDGVELRSFLKVT